MKKKTPLSTQKNENATTEEAHYNASTGEENEEKSPPTRIKSDSADNNQDSQQDQCISESTHEEKMPSTNNNSSSSIADLVPSQEIKFTPDYDAKEPVFWRIVGEISYNDGLVEYDKLQERLVATGQFFVGEAVVMIEHMEEIGRIEKTERYNIYRIREVPSPNEELSAKLSCVQT